MSLVSDCIFKMACLCQSCNRSEICFKYEKLLKNPWTDCCCFLSSGYEKETVHEKDTVKEIKFGAVIETVLEHALVQRPKQRI